MKLYTEEQVVRAMSLAVYNKYEKYMEVLDLLTPIELPSDEEINEIAKGIAHNYFVMQRNHYEGLEEGARRMAFLLMKHFKQEDNEKIKQV